MNLYDALLGNYGSEDDYIARDPFYQAGAGFARMPMPRATSNSEALLGPAVQGLLAGVLTGYGKERARDSQYSDLSRVLSAYSPEVYGLGERPDGWTGKQGQGDLFNALINLQQSNALELEGQKRLGALQVALAKDGKQINDKGQIVQIPGVTELLDEEIKREVDKKRQLAEAEAAGRRAGEGGGTFRDLPQQTQQQAAQVEGVTSQLERLADEFEALDQTTFTFQPSGKISGTKANELVSQMKVLLPTVVRMMGDVGNLADKEQQRILESTIGNWTSGSEGVATRLRNVAKMAKELANKRTSTLMQQRGANPEDIVGFMQQYGQTQPSEGTAKYTMDELRAAGYSSSDIVQLRLQGLVK